MQCDPSCEYLTEDGGFTDSCTSCYVFQRLVDDVFLGYTLSTDPLVRRYVALRTPLSWWRRLLAFLFRSVG